MRGEEIRPINPDRELKEIREELSGDTPPEAWDGNSEEGEQEDQQAADLLSLPNYQLEDPAPQGAGALMPAEDRISLSVGQKINAAQLRSALDRARPQPPLRQRADFSTPALRKAEENELLAAYGRVKRRRDEINENMDLRFEVGECHSPPADLNF